MAVDAAREAGLTNSDEKCAGSSPHNSETSCPERSDELLGDRRPGRPKAQILLDSLSVCRSRVSRASGRVGTWFSTTTWGSALWQRALVAVIAAVIFWPQPSVDPSVGLDPSWQAGLALARIDHIAWGRELVFTYGPLGFLRTSAYYSFEQSLLATICQVIIIAALFLGIAAACACATLR